MLVSPARHEDRRRVVSRGEDSPIGVLSRADTGLALTSSGSAGLFPVASWRPVLFSRRRRVGWSASGPAPCLTTARSLHRRPRSAGGRATHPRHGGGGPSLRESWLAGHIGSCTPCGRGWPRSRGERTGPATHGDPTERRYWASVTFAGSASVLFGVLGFVGITPIVGAARLSRFRDDASARARWRGPVFVRPLAAVVPLARLLGHHL